MNTKLRSTFVAGLMACAGLTAQAAYLVNTGLPDDPEKASALNPMRSLGISFDLNQAYTITSVEGYMFGKNGSTGSVKFSLFSGPPTLSAPMFSQVVAVPSAEGWRGLLGLSWAVNPGYYTVTFTTTDFTGGYMDNDALYPQPDEWTKRPGLSWVKSPAIDIAVRIGGVMSFDPNYVPVVPEPATYELLAAGFGLVPLIVRRRNRVPSSASSS